MSERAKWESVDGFSSEYRRLRVGPVEVRVVGACPAWEPGWAIEIVDDCEAATVDEAQRKAEQALREMHDALSAHFAPVLRWTNDDASYSEARLGEWCIQAWGDAFRIRCGGVGPVKSADCLVGGRVASKRAAEGALRALGVAFRVEGES